MCGIFGVIVGETTGLKKQEIVAVTNKLFELSELRGKESAGIAIKNGLRKFIQLYKDAIPAKKFIQTSSFKKLLHNTLQDCYPEQLKHQLPPRKYSFILTTYLLVFSIYEVSPNQLVF